MNKQEFEYFSEPPKKQATVITHENLTDKKARTLLYGYELDRSTAHLYYKEEKFIFVRYNSGNILLEHIDASVVKITETGSCFVVPEKKLYWGACDFEFCMLLKKAGVYLPFTKPSSPGDTEVKQYYGLTYEEVKAQ